MPFRGELLSSLFTRFGGTNRSKGIVTWDELYLLVEETTTCAVVRHRLLAGGDEARLPRPRAHLLNPCRSRNATPANAPG